MKECFIQIRGRHVDDHVKEAIVAIINSIAGELTTCRKSRGGYVLWYNADKNMHDSIIMALDNCKFDVSIGYSYDIAWLTGAIAD